MKNKRADISITILVLGVVAISILTIFSFINSKYEINEDFLGIGLIETMNSIEEEIKFNDKTEFESTDYKNVFERGNVIIEIDGNIMEGYYPDKEKRMVFVEYKFKP